MRKEDIGIVACSAHHQMVTDTRCFVTDRQISFDLVADHLGPATRSPSHRRIPFTNPRTFCRGDRCNAPIYISHVERRFRFNHMRTQAHARGGTGGSFTFTRASKIIDLAAEGQRGPAKPRSAASTAAAGAGDATEWPACVTSGAVDVRLTSIMNGAMRGSFH